MMESWISREEMSDWSFVISFSSLEAVLERRLWITSGSLGLITFTYGYCDGKRKVEAFLLLK